MTTYSATQIPTADHDGELFIGPVPSSPEDVEQIAASGFDTVVTLSMPEELEELGLEMMRDTFLRNGMNWTHFPIRDFDIPSAAETEAWGALETILVERLRRGGRIFIHCRAGFGRSGMIAARLLCASGTAPDIAVATVRAARPGAIETPEQMAWATRSGA